MSRQQRLELQPLRRRGTSASQSATRACSRLGVDQHRRGDDRLAQCDAAARRLGVRRRLRLRLARRLRWCLRRSLGASRAASSRLCSGPPRGKAMTLFSPGSLSASRNSPPCSRATAAARLKPKPGAGLRAALLQPHEPLDHAPAVGFRNARPVIGDREQDALARVGRAAPTISAGVPCRPSRRLGIFDRVVDQIGERLADQFAVAVTGAGASASTLSVMPFSSASGS